MSIDDTLKDRGSVYGDYGDGSNFRADVLQMMLEIYEKHNDLPMPTIYQIMLLDIIGKLVRLATTPNHIDSVHDIAGYATLYEQYLIGKQNAKKI
jgi:hypothetical protein